MKKHNLLPVYICPSTALDTKYFLLSFLLRLNKDKKYTLEGIDARNMIKEKLEGNYTGTIEIPWPQQPYMAVKARAR